MKNWILILGIATMFSGSGYGQYLTENWARTYDLGEGAQLHQLVQSMNGWLVGVGEVMKSGKADGLLLIIDPEQGDILYRRDFGGKADDVLYDLKQLPDGGFYLVGATESSGQGKRDAWLIRVDEYGQQIDELIYGTKDDEWFTHLNLFTDGHLLLSGQKGKKSNGEIWLTSVENMQVRSEVFIGDGRYNNVIGTATTPSNTAWLYGNTSGKKGSTPGRGWMVEVDPLGNIQQGTETELESYDFDMISSKGNTPWENILLSGTSRKGRQMDAWMLEVDDKGNELLNITYKSPDDEFGKGLVKTVFDKYLLAREAHSPIVSEGYQSKLVLIDGVGNDTEYIIPKEENIAIEHLLYTFERHFIVAGESYDAGQPNIRIISLEEDNRVSMKTGVKVNCSKPRLKDDNRNGILEKGERGAILFDITNAGNADIMDGTIQIIGRKGTSAFDKIFFSFLPVGGKKSVSIPVKGIALTPDESYELEIVVMERKQKINGFPFILKSKKSTTISSGISLEIITKWETAYSNSRKHNNIDVRVSEGNVRVNYEALAPYQMKNTDFKFRNKDRVYEDQKAQLKQFDVSNVSNDLYPYIHQLSFDAPLDTGENKIIIEIYKEGRLQKADTLSFLFLPQQPNLHVMVLAPETDLNYNVSDALEFARLMEAQAGKDYFKEVFIDTLVGYQETTTQNIRRAFAELRRRNKDRDAGRKSITDNDVLVVFISSHGLIGQDKRFKIMPSDYTTDEYLEDIYTIDYDRDILAPLKDIDCKKLVFIDACHSGAGGAKNSIGNLSEVLNDLNARAPGLLAISSSQRGELSYENEKWQNGAFTEAITEGFRGEPVAISPGLEVSPEITMTEDGLRLISVEHLFRFLQQRVPNLAQSLGSKIKQNPDIKNENESLMKIKFLITD
jgi:hypothetical protein